MISLHLSQLEKYFVTRTVFREITFAYDGHVLGIAGSNGSGKSTFLKCLGYLLRPSSGKVEWKSGGRVLAREQVRKQLGYAAPYINLYDELSCRENLEFLAKIRHSRQHEVHIKSWIQKVALEGMEDHLFGKLSTGQQQRLRLASALFHQPGILLLDEPGSNLDEKGRKLVTEIVETFKDGGKLLILASNDPSELDLCDDVFSIEKGAFL